MRYLDVPALGPPARASATSQQSQSPPQVSRIGLGTWQFGSKEWGYGEEYADHTAAVIVRRALDLGVTLFDTAEIYGFGRSERILAAALGADRTRVVVASKLFPILPVPAMVRRRAQASARRLQLDRIPLYQVHQPNPVVPDSVTMRGMGELLRDGRIGAVGVSNYSLARWRRADAALGQPVVSNQVEFSLARPGPLRDLVPFAQREDRVVIAYSPLAQGLLGGRYGPGNRPGGVRAANPLFSEENLRRAAPLLNRLREVAAAHDAKPAQVALAWLISLPQVVVIPGASSVEQLELNVAAAELVLADDEVASLTAAAQAFTPVSAARTAVDAARQRLSRGRR
ncbi:MAG TPA: aldo/keto reductase [Segeticoccus sp.]|uniref:aldo/keto reductase n=1 Tax=Segeticoccus sp. TaxID=2706531 RepID=UPI002D7F00EF|nr:aldo/keto reductase [Segeticoccus sp.]HET8599965.1 aldo/keto reductase [Segeticoccus sp.]